MTKTVKKEAKKKPGLEKAWRLGDLENKHSKPADPSGEMVVPKRAQQVAINLFRKAGPSGLATRIHEFSEQTAAEESIASLNLVTRTQSGSETLDDRKGRTRTSIRFRPSSCTICSAYMKA